MKYVVKQIIEPDFGCEGRPDGYTATDTVILKEENGQEIQMEIPDEDLYKKDINIGDWVYFDLTNQIYKEE